MRLRCLAGTAPLLGVAGSSPATTRSVNFNCQTAAHACFRRASSAPGWSGSGLAGLVCPKTPERVCGTRLSDQPRPRPRVWRWFKYTRACFTLDAVSRLRSARDGLTGLLASRLRVHLSWPHTIRFSRHVRTIARDALGPDCPMTPSSAASATESTTSALGTGPASQATVASRPANRDDRDAPLSSGRDGRQNIPNGATVKRNNQNVHKL